MICRRDVLAMLPCAAGLGFAQSLTRPIIDTHTHFYNPSRSGGVPWPPKTDPLLYRPVMPPEYQRLTAQLGIVGTVEIEASPLIEDNQWVLDLAQREPIIVATVGHLEPGRAGFLRDLERFEKFPRFKGIRIAAPWGKSVPDNLPSSIFFGDLKSVSKAGLQIDLIGDGDKIVPAALAISDRVPELRIVLNHLPFQRADESRLLQELGPRKRIYAKISNVPRRENGAVRKDLAYYQPALDEVYAVFGPDRVVYGSNWPVSERIAPFESALNLVEQYFESQGGDIADRFFFRNAITAYGLKLLASK